MHEMAIAQGILDITLKTAAQHKLNKVTGIKLLIGQMIQLEPEALAFGFAAISAGSIAEGALIDITIVPLVGQCNRCQEEFPIEKYCFVCPACNSSSISVLSGRELAVDYLEAE